MTVSDGCLHQSYKLFWFRGILTGICEGKSVLTFGEIVNHMIVDAWRPLLKCRLSLGPVDAVERLVTQLQEESGLSADANDREIRSALVVSSAPEIGRLKLRLIQNVPFRLQSPFIKDGSWQAWDDYEMTTDKINGIESAIYTISLGKALASRVCVRPEWSEYLLKNIGIVSAWTDAKLIEYLEKQNPGVKNIRSLLAAEEQAPAVWPGSREKSRSETAGMPAGQRANAAEQERVIVGKTGRKTLTPRQKLWRRIKREFPRKKFIGDIAITDEEFELLVDELNSQHRRLLTQPERFEADEVFCTALVQFGIRYYNDGAYWPFVEQRVNPGHFKAPHRTQFGNAFLEFMRRQGKLLNNEKKAMSNILLHGFVSNPKAPDLFNFLYSYYSIDLARDIERLDREAMNALTESIKANDGRNRTYNLVEHTADAVRLNEKGCKIRLRRYLKQIDRAFWNPEEFSGRGGNRLMRLFAEWCNNDNEKIAKERSDSRNSSMKHRSGWKPCLQYDFKDDLFMLSLPSRLVRGEEEPLTYWVVRSGDAEQRFDVSVEPAVTGYITREKNIGLGPDETFGEFEILFFCNGEQLGKWKIPAEPIRFFEVDGDYIDTRALRPGEAVSFSAPDYLPESAARYFCENWGGLIRCSYRFDDGDLIAFPDKKVLSIGKKPAEGLMNRGLQSGVYGIQDDKRFPVYSAAPSLFARILPGSMNGTQLRVNGNNYRLFEDREPAAGVFVFDLKERVPEAGVHVTLGQFGAAENGLYHVELDIPNDHSRRTWDFLLVNGMEYSFEEAPYIFVDKGVLCVPDKTGLEKLDDAQEESAEGQHRFAFLITADDDYFRLSLGGIPVAFEIPKLTYRFSDDEQWKTKLQVSIWHKDLPDIIQVRYPTDRLTLLLDEEGNETEEEEQHSQTYTRGRDRDCFICDIHAFRSWFGRRVATRRFYVLLPGMTKPARFMNLYTRDLFVSAVLSADLKNDIIHGEFDIIGKAPCFADIWYENELLLEKEPIIDGKISLSTEIRSGNYRADVFESEDDEDGFDEAAYAFLDSKTMELINPSNLTGKHIEVKQLMRSDSDTYLRLKRSYILYDLEPMKDRGKGYYSGHLIIRDRESGKYRDDYPACLYIPDPEELSRGYLFQLDEYGDEESFIYDTDRHYIRREEDRKVTGITRYRRFLYLWDEGFFYRISFVEKPADADSRLETERAERALQLQGREQNEKRKEYLRQLDPLCKRIDQIWLPIRIVNELINAGILYTTDLVNMTGREISRVHGLNRTDIEQCIAHLRKAGYRISMF